MAMDDGIDRNNIMNVSRSRAVVLTVGILMVLSSGVAWFMYMANGIAYGSIVGLRGRDADLNTFRFRAEAFLASAALLQAIGIGVIVSAALSRLPGSAEMKILRLAIPIAVDYSRPFDLNMHDSLRDSTADPGQYEWDGRLFNRNDNKLLLGPRCSPF